MKLLLITFKLLYEFAQKLYLVIINLNLFSQKNDAYYKPMRKSQNACDWPVMFILTVVYTKQLSLVT